LTGAEPSKPARVTWKKAFFESREGWYFQVLKTPSSSCGMLKIKEVTSIHVKQLLILTKASAEVTLPVTFGQGCGSGSALFLEAGFGSGCGLE
jgi:hypothetical protein